MLKRLFSDFAIGCPPEVLPAGFLCMLEHWLAWLMLLKEGYQSQLIDITRKAAACVLYIVFIYQITSLYRGTTLSICCHSPPSNSSPHKSPLEKLFGLGCCPWIRDRHRYYSCVYILDEIEGIPIPFGGLNVVEMGWKVILFLNTVQLGFLKANIVTSDASLLKMQNYCPKWLYIHIGD